MLRLAIIEDEAVYAIELKNALLACFDYETPQIDCYQSGEAFLSENWKNKAFAAAFIDIELPKMNGLETAKKMRENGYRNMIVFTTNFQQFVYEGYEVEAFRYLLKPVKKEDIQPCVDRVIQDMQGKSLMFSFDRKKYNIPYDEIIYISSYGHYLTIHTKERDYEWKYSLKELQAQLPDQFVRCHRSFIVNLNYIRKLDTRRIILKNNEKIDVSNGYLEPVRKALSRSI